MTLNFNISEFAIFFIASVVVILLNGFFVALEYAIISIRASKIEELVQKNVKGAKRVEKVIENKEKVISGIQVGITMSSLALGFLSGDYFEPLMADVLSILNPSLRTFGLVLAFLLSTFFLVVFGELVFKNIALKYNVFIGLHGTYFLNKIMFILKPFVYVIYGTANLFLRAIGLGNVKENLIHNENEIKVIIERSKKEGILDLRESEIILNSFELSDKITKEIMVPRSDIAILRSDLSYLEGLEKLAISGHTRLPIYDVESESILGTVNVKDAMKHLVKKLKSRKIPDKIDFQEIMRKIDYVPDTMPIISLLEYLQNKKRRVAYVVNEFGQMIGMVSIEDITEELVGQIQDEYDKEARLIEPIVDGFIIDGRTPLTLFNDFFQTSLESEFSVTLGGFLIERHGYFPKVNELIEVNCNNKLFQFIITNLSKNKVATIKVKELELENDSSEIESI